jgi:arylsulfatase
LPYFKGEVDKGPRETIIYFSQGGELNAVRWNDWKVNFAGVEGNIASGSRVATNWPLLVNLRADPFEQMPFESMMYMRWYADNMWLFVPVQQGVREFLATIPEYPVQFGSSLSASNIDYSTLRTQQALDRLQQLEGMTLPMGQ